MLLGQPKYGRGAWAPGSPDPPYTDGPDIQWLTIAIVFELIYTYMAMFRVKLTFINIDPKCHSYLVYEPDFPGLNLIIFS